MMTLALFVLLAFAVGVLTFFFYLLASPKKRTPKREVTTQRTADVQQISKWRRV